MISQKYGRISNVSSVAGLRGGTGRSAYSASKGGVIALTKVLAIELSPYNITVNTLCPGGVFNNQDDNLVKEVSARVPMARMADRKEISSALLFLLSDQSSYVHGASLVVDGGRTIW